MKIQKNPLTAADKRGNKVIEDALVNGPIASGGQPARWMKRMLDLAGYDAGSKHADIGTLTPSIEKQLRKEINATKHVPFRRRGQKEHKRLDALTGKEAGKPGGIAAGDKGRAVANIQAHLKAAGFDPKS